MKIKIFQYAKFRDRLLFKTRIKAELSLVYAASNIAMDRRASHV